jgi:DNA-binding transcriptional LysR family regulator
MVARVLRPYAMVICASPAYLARHGTPRTPADLARHECLDFMQWTRHVRWRLAAGSGDDDGTPESRFRSNNGQALRMAALHGFGIVMQAEILTGRRHRRRQAGAAAGRLRAGAAPHAPVYPRDRHPTPKLTTFIDFLLERYGPAATPPPATLT